MKMHLSLSLSASFVFLVSVFLSGFAWADTPEAVALAYFSDLESGNYAAAAEKFDPEQLAEFRTQMEFYKEIPLDAQSQFIQMFFGSADSVESIDKLTDVEFFSGLFVFMQRQVELAGRLSFDGIEILGSVEEGEDVSHLVTRNRVSVEEIEIEALEVVSLKKQGEKWYMMLQGQLKGLPQQLKIGFGAANK